MLEGNNDFQNFGKWVEEKSTLCTLQNIVTVWQLKVSTHVGSFGIRCCCCINCIEGSGADRCFEEPERPSSEVENEFCSLKSERTSGDNVALPSFFQPLLDKFPVFTLSLTASNSIQYFISAPNCRFNFLGAIYKLI